MDDARNAAEAIRMPEQRDNMRLVFTDVVMPGKMDRLKLAAYIGQRWPPIALVVTSAVFEPRYRHLPANSRFFIKPYQRAKVEAAIRVMLTGAGRAASA